MVGPVEVPKAEDSTSVQPYESHISGASSQGEIKCNDWQSDHGLAY